MPEGINTWIKLAMQEPLPQMRRTSESLRRLAGINDPELDRIVEVIRQDCGFTIQLLRRMSELKTQRQIAEVTTLERAVVMLGSGRVISLVEELPVVEDLLDGDRLLGYVRATARSFHAGRQAFDWARIRGDIAPNELSLAAFLYDLAELVLWRFGEDEMLNLERLSRADRFDEIGPDELEIEILGFETTALGRELAKRWQLPALVYTCQKPISALEPRTLGPVFAAKLARAVQYGWYHPSALELVGMAGDYLGMSSGQGASRVHAEAVATSRMVKFPGVTPVAAGLLYCGEIPQIIIEPKRESRKKETPAPRSEPQADAKKTSAPTDTPASNLRIYHLSLEQISKKKLGVHAILETAINGIHNGLGLSRVLFAVLTPDKRTLVVRYCVCEADDSRLKGVGLSLMPPNLLTRMMEEPRALWVNEGNVEKLWPHVPQKLREFLKIKTFFIMSVFANGKPLGLFCADKADSEGVLDRTGFMAFKSICTLTGQALARAGNSAKAQKKTA